MIEEVHRTDPAGKPVSELVADLSEQTKRLVRDEMRLATAELRRKGKRMGVGAGMFGAAGVLALFGGATFVAAAVLALALVVEGWLAAVLVGAALLLVAGVTALIGRGRVRRATPPVPEEAIDGVKTDVETVKGKVHR